MTIVDIMTDVEVIDDTSKQSELANLIARVINETEVANASVIVDLGHGPTEYQYSWIIYPDTKEHVLVIGKRLDTLDDPNTASDTYYRFIYPDMVINIEPV